MSIGKIYILKNDSYRNGIYKIGKTSRSSGYRAQELSTHTAVPAPFRTVFEIETDDYDLAERLIFEKLADYRYAQNREFFKIPFQKAVEAILNVVDTINETKSSHVARKNKPDTFLDELLFDVSRRDLISTPHQIKEILRKKVFDDQDIIALFGKDVFERAKNIHYSDYIDKLEAMGDMSELIDALEFRHEFEDIDYIVGVIMKLTAKEKLAICMHYHNEGRIDSYMFNAKTYYHKAYEGLIYDRIVGFHYQKASISVPYEYGMIFQKSDRCYGYFYLNQLGNYAPSLFKDNKGITYVETAIRAVCNAIYYYDFDVIKKPDCIHLLTTMVDFDHRQFFRILNNI